MLGKLAILELVSSIFHANCNFLLDANHRVREITESLYLNRTETPPALPRSLLQVAEEITLCN